MKHFIFLLSILFVGCAHQDTLPVVNDTQNPFQPDYYVSRGLAANGLSGCTIGKDKKYVVPVGMNIIKTDGSRCACSVEGKIDCKSVSQKNKISGCKIDNYIIGVGQSLDAPDGCNTCLCKETSLKMDCSTEMSCGL